MNLFQTILSLLTKDERKAIYKISILSIIGALLETFSLLMIFPLLESIINKNFQIPYSEKIYSTLNFAKDEQIYFILLFFLVISFLKTLFLIYLSWAKADTSVKIHNNFITRIYKSYISRNYEEYATINTGTILHKVTTETNIIMQNSIGGLLNILKDLFLVSFTTSILLYTNYQVTLILFGLVFSFGYTINKISKNLSQRWGKIRKDSEESRLRTIKQSIENIIEIILLDKSQFFLQDITNDNNKLIDVVRKQATLRNLPRPTLEFIATLGVIIAIVILIQNNPTRIDTIIPTLGLFGIIALRIIPSMSHILRSLYNIRYSLPSVFDILNDLSKSSSDYHSPNTSTQEPFSFKSLELLNISFKHRGEEDFLLKNVNMFIKKGEMVGIIGKSGCGKSTLANIMLGLFHDYEGKLIINSKEVQKDDFPKWHKTIGYVSQNPVLLDKPIIENITFGNKTNFNSYKIKDSLEKVKLIHFFNDNKLKTSTIGEFGSKLSGGERQRVTLARALYHDRDILILDEPTSSLDPNTKDYFLETLRELKGKKTIILISHQYETMKYCDRFYKVKNKKVMEVENINED